MCVWVFRVRYMSVSEVCMCMGCVVCESGCVNGVYGYWCVVCVSGVYGCVWCVCVGMYGLSGVWL